MAYGLGEKLPNGGVSWAKLAKLLPSKLEMEISEYGKLFETYLSGVEPGSSLLPGSVPLQCVFMDLRPQEVIHGCMLYI